jgi:hypothetical protein
LKKVDYSSGTSTEKKLGKIIFDAFKTSQNDDVLYQTHIQDFWDAYPNHILPKFVFEDWAETSKHGFKQS